MRQHVWALLIGHHQAKHVLYNTQKEYIKCITTAERSPNIETPRPPGTTKFRIHMDEESSTLHL